MSSVLCNHFFSSIVLQTMAKYPDQEQKEQLDDQQQQQTPEQHLEALTSLLSRHHQLANSCSVDFLVKDLWQNVVAEELRVELEGLGEGELAALPSLLLGEQKLEGEVGRLLEELRRHRLEVLGLLREQGDEEAASSLLDHFDRIMPKKKTHEVRYVAHPGPPSTMMAYI